MKRSNDPIFWSLFGAGGMLSALVAPILIFITGIIAPLAAALEPDPPVTQLATVDPPPPALAAAPQPAPVSPDAGGVYLQLGALGSKDNAENFLARMKIQTIESSDGGGFAGVIGRAVPERWPSGRRRSPAKGV